MAFPPYLLDLTFLQSGWHALEGFGTRLTPYLCLTSGHVLKRQNILRKKTPDPGKSVRLASQQIRLIGVLIEGPLEPSHSLIDYVFGLKEAETLRYVDPAKCTSRAMELLGVNKQSGIKVNAPGQVIIEDKPSVLTTNISCEFRCRQALQRRSLGRSPGVPHP